MPCRNKLYTIESQSKSSWMSSGGRERRIWKAWEGIMCCWFMAPWWPGRKQAMSAAAQYKRRPPEHFPCARDSAHITSYIFILQISETGFKRMSKWLKVTQLVRGRDRIWTQFTWLQNQHSLHYTRLQNERHTKSGRVPECWHKHFSYICSGPGCLSHMSWLTWGW